MGTLWSILGGLAILLLGVCGSFEVCSNCEHKRFQAERAEQVARDRAAQPGLDARLQALLPERVGRWSRADKPRLRPVGLLGWLVEYRDAAYAEEAAFQASPEGEAAFQAWRTELAQRVDALQERVKAEEASKAPQPVRFDAILALAEARGQLTRGREGWSRLRMAAHSIALRVEVIQKDGLSQNQWTDPADAPRKAPEGWDAMDRGPLRGADHKGWRDRIRLGAWTVSGAMLSPSPTASRRCALVTLEATAASTLEDFEQALDWKALAQGLEAP